MTKNLLLINKTISDKDSDIGSSSAFSIPSSAANFTESANQNVAFYYGPFNTVYYTWFTATGGSGLSTTKNTEVGTSICAKNWKLPSNSIYQELIDRQGSNLSASPANFTGQVGYMHPGWSNPTQDLNTFYWTSTASKDGVRAGNLAVGWSVCPECSNTGQKTRGHPIRCYAK